MVTYQDDPRRSGDCRCAARTAAPPPVAGVGAACGRPGQRGLAILAALASRYQPIGNGEDLSFAFPGLPAGQGLRVVNNLGEFHQDIYVPPQRGTFALVATIMNNGTHPVTIVSALAPQGSGLWLAGAIRYSTPGMDGSNQIPPPTSRVLRNVELAPGQEMCSSDSR